MRRWLTVFLLILLPLQLSWAVAATYCAHEADPAVNHIGHHQHRHEAAAVSAVPVLSGGPDAIDAATQVGTAADKTAEKPAEKTADKAADKAADSASDDASGKTPRKATETPADKALTCVDDDCGFCHLGHSQPVASTAIVLPAVASPAAAGSVPEVWSSRGPDRREKPNWLTA
ncbi:hypothetical protein ACQ86G_20830 [Roseateles chitinivorans]|uniref:hypothetical protein n=1 Tax=Roseateles chitinivorans TaxID=2917965 RepID=UPI003D66C77A